MGEQASEADLYEFQTRLLEETYKITQEFRRNSTNNALSSDDGYTTLGGTIPPTMVVPVGPTIPGALAVESLLSTTDEESTANYKFIDLPVSIVQMLSPKVEIFKVYKSEEGSELPDRIYPLHQGAHRKEDMVKALRDGDMTAFDDSMQGVVLQAVDFTRLGGNPAEVHTNIKFNIRLYAKSITEFFTRTDAKPEGVSFDTIDTATTTDTAAVAAVINYNQSIEDFSAPVPLAILADVQRSMPSTPVTAADVADINQTRVSQASSQRREVREAYADALDIKKVAWIDIIKIDPGQELNATITPANGVAPFDPNNPVDAQTRRAQSNQLVVSERAVRIMARISYTLPKNPPTDIQDDAWDDWKRVVSEQKEVFFLSLLGHEFSFLGMQGVELSVDFVAAGNAKALQPSFDLLGGLDFENWRLSQQNAFSTQRRQRERNQELLARLQADVAQYESRIDATQELKEQGSSTTTPTEFQFLIEQLRTKINNANAKISRCIEYIEAANEGENAITDAIKEVRGIYKARLLSQIYLDPASLSRRRSGAIGSIQTRLHNAEVNSISGNESDIRLFNLQELNERYSASTDAWILSSPTEERLDYLRDRVNLATTVEETGTLRDSANAKLQGDFVFLGDIIEAAYETIVSQVANGGDGIAEVTQNLQDQMDAEAALSTAAATRGSIITADTAISTAQAYIASRNDYYPTLASRSPDDFTLILNKFDTITTGRVEFPIPYNSSETETINIRDIPISYDLFRQWWLRKAESKNFYPLRDFIPDLMMFVTDIFQKVKYRDSSGDTIMTSNQLPRFILNNVLFATSNTSEQINEERRYKYTSKDSFIRKLATSKSDTTGKSTTVIEQIDITDMPSDDVPNIIFGQADRGILKQVTFEREDIPGHAEARLMADRESVASNIALREKYNVTLEMRGTTSFLPGSVLYLDITPIELGYTSEDNSYAKQLGLGGMYRVVSVQSSLGLDGKGNSWTTRIKTKWESFGDGTNGDPSAPISHEYVSDTDICRRGVQ